MSSDESICRTSSLDEKVIIDLCSPHPEEVEQAVAVLPRALTEQEVWDLSQRVHNSFGFKVAFEASKQEQIAISNVGHYALDLLDLVTAESVAKTLWQRWSVVKALDLKWQLSKAKKGIINELMEAS